MGHAAIGDEDSKSRAARRQAQARRDDGAAREINPIDGRTLSDSTPVSLDNSYWSMTSSLEEGLAIGADLGSQLEAFVAKLVASGRYNSKSEVLREGVRLIQEREARLAALDASIARGLADADAGRAKPAEAVFNRLEAKFKAKA